MNRLIFGYGYLGSRVGKRWLEAGDKVYALTRLPDRANELSRLGIEPIVGDITDPLTLNNLPLVDTILFAVGMDRSRYSVIRDVYVKGLQNVLEKLPHSQSATGSVLSTTTHFIYVSSTGVYGDFGGDWIDELSPTDPKRDGGKACLEAEAILRSQPSTLPTTILRFAGIYGPNRVPTRSTIAAKDWQKLTGEGFLNLIQVDDGAAIVDEISNQSSDASRGETFIVSDGAPARRRDYYDFVASHLGIGAIPWCQTDSTNSNSRSSANKRVSNKKLINLLEFEFQHPNFKSGLNDAFKDSNPD